MKINKNLVLFYLSRFFGLALKPLTLWCTLNFGTESWSEFFAKLFFIVPATFIAFNNDGHILYYKHKFGAEPAGAKTALAFRTYVSHLLSHIALFSVPLVICFALYLKDVGLALAFLLFAIHEKVFDEILRYQLFARRYDTWAKCFLLKAALPFLALTASYFPLFSRPALTLVVLTTAVTGLALKAITTTGVRGLFGRLLRECVSGKAFLYLRSYRKQYIVNQLAALCAFNLIAVDKWIGGSRWSARTLAEVVLVGQFGSAYLVLLDNLFFTVNRDRFVKHNVERSEIVPWPSLIFLSFAATGVFAVTLIWLKAPLGFLDLPTSVIVAIFLLSVFKGLSRPLEEYAFWHNSRASALSIDASCVLILYVVGKLVFSTTSLSNLYLACLGILLLRMGLYFLLTNRRFRRPFALIVEPSR